MNVIHHIVCRGESAAVDRSFPCDAYVFLPQGKNHGSPFDIGVLDVVPGIGGSEKSRSGLQMQGYSILEINGSGHVIARTENKPAASVRADKVDCCLNAGGVQSPSVCLDAEVRSWVVGCIHCSGKQKNGKNKREDGL